jgi:hypothetical protein
MKPCPCGAEIDEPGPNRVKCRRGHDMSRSAYDEYVAASADKPSNGQHDRDDSDSIFPIIPIKGNTPNTQLRNPTKSFKLTSLRDLLNEDAEEIAAVVDETLPVGGISMIAAKPKVGKSTTARSLAVKVARGDDFLGRTTTKGAVVYLALEEKRSEVAKHFARMGASDESIFVHVGAAPEDALAALKSAIVDHKPVLAIVDPLLKLVRLRDANDYAEVSRAMEPLIELARTSGCHILCVHHLGKGERTGGDAILGSTALFGAVDTAILMRRRNDQRVIESVQRYGSDFPESVVTLDADTGIVAVAGEVAAIDRTAMGDKILAEIAGEQLTRDEINARVGGNPTPIASALNALIEDGKIRRSGAGKKGDPYIYEKAVFPVPQQEDDPANTPNRANMEMPQFGQSLAEDDDQARSACAVCGEPLPAGARYLCEACG